MAAGVPRWRRHKEHRGTARLDEETENEVGNYSKCESRRGKTYVRDLVDRENEYRDIILTFDK